MYCCYKWYPVKPHLFVVHKSIQYYVLLSCVMLDFDCYCPFMYVRKGICYVYSYTCNGVYLYLIFVCDVVCTSSMYVAYDMYLSVSYLYSCIINIQKKFIKARTQRTIGEHINAYVYLNWV